MYVILEPSNNTIFPGTKNQNWLPKRLELSVLTNSEMLKRRTRYLLPTIYHNYHAICVYIYTQMQLEVLIIVFRNN